MATIPINEERRQTERRSNWHTPDDCAKLLGVQLEISGIVKRLDKGDERMSGIERLIAEGSKVAMEERTIIKQMMFTNHERIMREMSEATAKIAAADERMQKPIEIIESAEGFFNGVVSTGKWTRRIIMWFFPAATAIISFVYTLQQMGIL